MMLISRLKELVEMPFSYALEHTLSTITFTLPRRDFAGIFAAIKREQSVKECT